MARAAQPAPAVAVAVPGEARPRFEAAAPLTIAAPDVPLREAAVALLLLVLSSGSLLGITFQVWRTVR